MINIDQVDFVKSAYLKSARAYRLQRSEPTKMNNLQEAHESMAAVLDEKLSTSQEWLVFRSIDQMLLNSLRKAPLPSFIRRQPEQVPYMTLVDAALKDSNKPLTTNELVTYISHKRGSEPKKIKAVVSSSLSKDKRFCNIPFADHRAWWYTNRNVPLNGTAESAAANAH